MTSESPQVEADRRLIAEAQARGRGATALAYVRLSGPGWLQSAITLGGGSLANSLYLGVLTGFSMLWLQPLAMVLGIVMLGAIGYVTLSTGERPFRAINEHVNPVLGWGWALAALAANMVWCLPQFALANGVLQQNLAPDLLGADGPLGDTGAKVLIAGSVLVLTVAITWAYDSGHWGVRVYEALLKLMVALIVLCFFGVVIAVSRSEEGLNFGAIAAGFVPRLSQLSEPAATFQESLQAIRSSAGAAAADFWSDRIVSEQRSVMIGAAATAVGINMTFLFPYTLLRRGWDKTFRGLAVFDLSTGMLIPFVMATSCVIIASATQFHVQPAPGFLGETDADGNAIAPAPKLASNFDKLLAERAALDSETAWAELDAEQRDALVANIGNDERRLAATLVKRDSADLALALEPLAGTVIANLVFGLGVLGMTLSTITILMLISGFAICEMLGLPDEGWPHRIGCLAAAVGALGPFIWG